MLQIETINFSQLFILGTMQKGALKTKLSRQKLKNCVLLNFIPYLSKDFQYLKLGSQKHSFNQESGLKGSVVPVGRPRRTGAGSAQRPAKQFATARRD